MTNMMKLKSASLEINTALYPANAKWGGRWTLASGTPMEILHTLSIQQMLLNHVAPFVKMEDLILKKNVSLMLIILLNSEIVLKVL